MKGNTPHHLGALYNWINVKIDAENVLGLYKNVKSVVL